MVEFAPAKVNLALHVTGKRPDGYHLLDSLVCFPTIGDQLQAEPASSLSLEIEGPYAATLASGHENLVLRAAALLARRGGGARIRLRKTLPVSSGLGGGSADAAAALRLLSRVWSAPLPLEQELTALGADVPVCLRSRPARMRGIGERIDPVRLPYFWIVLANPGRPVATASVFAKLVLRNNSALPNLPSLHGVRALAEWLRKETRNDLQDTAQSIEPAIADALAALEGLPGCRLARMSGSGATCFGIFEEEETAVTAAAKLRNVEPGWWVAAAASEDGAAWPERRPGL